MNTQELANAVVAYNREGKFPQVFQDLYAEGFTSREMPGSPNELTTGLEEVSKKGEWWEMNFDMHEVKVSDPLVADDWFAIRYWMDTTDKNTGERTESSELGVYRVKDGKVVSEQFFYNTEA